MMQTMKMLQGHYNAKWLQLKLLQKLKLVVPVAILNLNKKMITSPQFFLKDIISIDIRMVCMILNLIFPTAVLAVMEHDRSNIKNYFVHMF
ncbi:hypothetical protein AC067_10735 [Escherichia coli]|nr:hypothetical protein AC067_10735 [Escherichia coli]